MSDSVRPHRRQPTRLPCPWDSPGKNTGVGCHFLLRGTEWNEGSPSSSGFAPTSSPSPKVSPYHHFPPPLGVEAPPPWALSTLLPSPPATAFRDESPSRQVTGPRSHVRMEFETRCPDTQLGTSTPDSFFSSGSQTSLHVRPQGGSGH